MEAVAPCNYLPGHDTVCAGWEKLVVIGEAPPPRQSASTWVTDEDTVWLFGGLGASPSQDDGTLSHYAKQDPYDQDGETVANVDNGGFRQDMWEGKYATDPKTGKRVLDWVQVKHDNSAASMMGWEGLPGSSGTVWRLDWPAARSMAMSWIDEAKTPMLFGGYRMGLYGMSDLWRFEKRTQQWLFLGGSDPSALKAIHALPDPLKLVDDQSDQVEKYSWPMARGHGCVAMQRDGSGGYLFGGAVQVQTASWDEELQAATSQIAGFNRFPPKLDGAPLSDLWYINSSFISTMPQITLDDIPCDDSGCYPEEKGAFGYLGPLAKTYINDPGIKEQSAAEGNDRGVLTKVHTFLDKFHNSAAAHAAAVNTEALWPSSRAGHAGWLDEREGGARFYIFGGVGTSADDTPQAPRGDCMMKQDLWRYDPGTDNPYPVSPDAIGWELLNEGPPIGSVNGGFADVCKASYLPQRPWGDW